METIFDKIIKKEIKSWTVWEDSAHLAFLTPFPSTPGQTIVIPKTNPGDYIFSVEKTIYQKLMLASKKVANILEKAFDTPRVAMVFEGTGVPHVHAKLYPLHGDLNIQNNSHAFFSEYPGFISTSDGPKMSDAELDKIQSKILKATQ